MESTGLSVVEFPQTDARMSPASQLLYDAVVERRVTHDGSAQLAQHVANTLQRTSRRGWRFDRGGNGAAKIDGLIALTMAYDRSQNRAPAAAFLGWV